MWFFKRVDSIAVMRTATKTEYTTIVQLQKDLTTHYEEGVHETLLQRLWKGLLPGNVVYAKVSSQWLRLGFQSEDPSIDFRGGGKVN